MVVIADYQRTATFAWSHDKIPVLATGSISGSISADFSSESKLEFWSLLDGKNEKPFHSIETSSKFNDLDWSIDNKIIAGALDDGTVEFYSAPTSSTDSSNSKIITSLKKHSTSVKTLKFNPKLGNVLISGDSKGLINVWDTNKITDSGYSPTQPGQSITSIDEIKCLAWNKSLSHVFANAGSSSGFASVWDLKTKKEVIHLSYTSPITNSKVPLDIVEWHPSNSTRIATASNTDLDPSILIWDLRQPNSPITTLSNVHSKGILSLDWCTKDSDLLISSGSDNTVVLWDPETLKTSLTVYPARSNWLFKTKFAPELPDVFASSGFDNKIEVQSLQNLPTQLDEKKSTEIINETEDDFWNTVSVKNSAQDFNMEKPKVNHIYAPKWLTLQKSPAAQWAFGGKLVYIGSDGKSVHITKPENLINSDSNTEMLTTALTSKDFNPIINRRLNNSINPINEEDWSMLEKLSMDGKQDFLKELLAFDDEESGDEETEDKDQEGKDFFENLETEKFSPSSEEPFKLDITSSDLVKLLANHDFVKSIHLSLEAVDNTDKDEGLLLESFIIALISKQDSLIKKVVEKYFAKYGPKSSLARYLFSLSSSNFDDLIENSEVSQWKYVAKTINNYVSDNDLKSKLLTKLGDRVLDNGERQDALILYMASNNIDKISGIWLKEFNDLEIDLQKKNGKKTTNYESHLQCLTEFVERFSCFSNTFNDGSKFKLENEELISKFLEFVSLISSNGDFDLALQFLNALPGDNADVNTEKQRVLIASGKAVSSTKASAGASAASKARTVAAKRTSVAPSTFIGSQSSSMFTAPVQPQPALSSYAPQASVNVPQPYMPAAGAPVASSVVNPYAPARSSVSGIPANQSYAPPPTVSAPRKDSSVVPPFGQSPLSLSNATVTAPVAPVPNTINPYKPVASVIPATQAASTPGTPGVANGLANNSQFGGQPAQAGYYGNGSSSSPAPSSTMNGSYPMSGQTPSLNKKANEGWNDLDLPVKDKIVRAKPVITKPVGGSSDFDAAGGIKTSASPLSATGIKVPPPPTSSRISSQAQTAPPPVGKAPLKRVTSEASVKYAPPPQAASASQGYSGLNGVAYAPSSSGVSTPSPTIINPYAPPPPAAAAATVPALANPYAPPPQKAATPHGHGTSRSSANKFVPPTPASSNFGGIAPPQTSGAPPQASMMPPPPPMKRKSHAVPAQNVEQALSQLDSIKQNTPGSVAPGVPEPVVEQPQPVSATPAAASNIVASVAGDIVGPSAAQQVSQDEVPVKSTAISEEELQIIEFFKQELLRVTPLVPQEYSKQLKDSNKRLKLLFQHLENQDLLSSTVVSKLSEITNLMKEGKYTEAKTIQVEIATTYPQEAGNWLTGVKRLINIAEATAGTSSA
ncbi:hypothetical protein ACO0QE_004356 [Hanseniaspora vineae]